jgi:hypothetical protein
VKILADAPLLSSKGKEINRTAAVDYNNAEIARDLKARKTYCTNIKLQTGDNAVREFWLTNQSA